ncbi:sigma 54-interacting transcriptional regulator [bacterium]|nr:sigma 54-interacting transcriptional regulator [bacterium]
MKSTAKNRNTSKTSTEAILESISDGVFTVDKDWRISSFNRAAEEITGVTREEALGQRCADVFRSCMCGNDCALKQTLKTGKPVIGRSGYIISYDGEKIPISLSTAVLRDSENNIIGGAETFRDLSEVDALRRELEGRSKIGELVSRSPLMQRLFEVLPVISASPSTVLILGDTGTGKELVAKTIHELSPRHDKPFVAVNCGALPESLLESELFGYKAGAFTGAVRNKPGRFERAEGGTLFLDEIAEISPAIQVKLLRVLQDKTFDPLGSSHSVKSDVRIILATNRDLSVEMKEGRFREDLYYRINIVRIELPPLRKRKEDIPLLVDFFINRFNQIQGKSVEAIDVEALSLLLAHDWQGNVRELENAIERAFVLCSDGTIKIHHLPVELISHSSKLTNQIDTNLTNIQNLVTSQTIRTVLENNNNNRTEAAKELGIHKTTLFRLMKKLDIPLPEQDGRSTRQQ